MAITIRKLQPQDSLIYREIRRACLKNAGQYFGATYEEEARQPRLRFQVFIEADSPDHFIYGAFDDEKLIGTVGFERGELQQMRHRGEVVQVYVDPGYRGQKVGEKLMRAVLEQAFSLEGIEHVQLSVAAHNQAAIALYEKLGFKTWGIQPQCFKNADGYIDQQFMKLFKSCY